MRDARTLDQVEATAGINHPVYKARQDKAVQLLEFLRSRLNQEGQKALEDLEHELAQAQGIAVRQAYIMGLEAAGKKE